MATRANSAHPAVSVVIATLNRRWYLKRAMPAFARSCLSPRRRSSWSTGDRTTAPWAGWPSGRTWSRSFSTTGPPARAARPAQVVGLIHEPGIQGGHRSLHLHAERRLPGRARRDPHRLERLEREGEDVGAIAFYWRNWPEQERYSGRPHLRRPRFRQPRPLSPRCPGLRRLRRRGEFPLLPRRRRPYPANDRRPAGNASTHQRHSSSTTRMPIRLSGRPTWRPVTRTGPPTNAAGHISVPPTLTGSSFPPAIPTTPPAATGDQEVC